MKKSKSFQEWVKNNKHRTPGLQPFNSSLRKGTKRNARRTR